MTSRFSNKVFVIDLTGDEEKIELIDKKPKFIYRDSRGNPVSAKEQARLEYLDQESREALVETIDLTQDEDENESQASGSSGAWERARSEEVNDSVVENCGCAEAFITAYNWQIRCLECHQVHTANCKQIRGEYNKFEDNRFLCDKCSRSSNWWHL